MMFLLVLEFIKCLWELIGLLSNYHNRKKVLWIDETKINRIGSDGKVYVWKQQGKPVSDRTITPTVKHGGGNNLMIWGCMSWNGVGTLIKV